jgi:hypothetical protein
MRKSSRQPKAKQSKAKRAKAKRAKLPKARLRPNLPKARPAKTSYWLHVSEKTACWRSFCMSIPILV